MADPNVYTVQSLNDFLSVPAELRPRLFHDLQTALLTIEVGNGVKSPEVGIVTLSWASDADLDILLTDEAGETIIALKSVPAEHPMPAPPTKGAANG